MTDRWISIVGIGDDGPTSLSPAARALIDTAEVLIGGERHLAMFPVGGEERRSWGDGIDHAVSWMAERRGQRVVVLASGDPFDYGIGTVLARHFKAAEMTVVPAPGAFSLACARMCWSRPDVKTITLHGRPLESLALFLADAARLVILSRDGETPGKVAALLESYGYGKSQMTVLEHMGGRDECRLDGIASAWSHPRCADLNVIAIQCLSGPGAKPLSRVPGLPEEAFEHDGRITKREVRATSLSRLMPMPGQVLWDIGSGCGSVAIEWLRAEPDSLAIAIEDDTQSCARIARNALNLGTPRLKVIQGHAPEVLSDISPSPNAVFIGGGIASNPTILAASLELLSPGGRLVANAVTVEAEKELLAFHNEHGGEMVRLSVARAASVGRFVGFKPFMTVTQYCLVK